jgi:hypothetical protein
MDSNIFFIPDPPFGKIVVSYFIMVCVKKQGEQTSGVEDKDCLAVAAAKPLCLPQGGRQGCTPPGRVGRKTRHFINQQPNNHLPLQLADEDGEGAAMFLLDCGQRFHHGTMGGGGVMDSELGPKLSFGTVTAVQCSGQRFGPGLRHTQ